MSANQSHDVARGAVIEIVERRTNPDTWTPPAADLIVPDEIRINGQPLLASADHPVKVHEVSINGGDAVAVTLTLFARRVSIGAEPSTTDTAIPVSLKVGRSASYVIGTVADTSDVPGLLKAVADEWGTM